MYDMSCTSMVCEMVMAMAMFSVVLGQATMETGDVEFINVGSVEGFMKTREFRVSYGARKHLFCIYIPKTGCVHSQLTRPCFRQ